MSTRFGHRLVAVVVAVALATVSAPGRARAETSINATGTIGLLLVVVGTLGWVAWTMEREDKADRFQSSALVPLYRIGDARAAVGLMLDERELDETIAVSAGLAVGRRF